MLINYTQKKKGKGGYYIRNPIFSSEDSSMPVSTNQGSSCTGNEIQEVRTV